MGSFVTLFNYIGYRLLSPQWLLSQAMVGLLSVIYLTGSWSSPKAGALTARYGRGPVMMVAGLLLTLLAQLVAIFIGMMLFAGGFLPRIPSPAVGLAAARVAPKDRPPRCICSVTTSAPVPPVTWAGSFGTATAGRASWPLLPCSCWLAAQGCSVFVARPALRFCR